MSVGAQAFSREQHRLDTPILMVLLKKPLPLNGRNFRGQLKVFFENESLEVTASGDEKQASLALNWDGYSYAAYLVDKPVPENEFFASLQKSASKATLEKVTHQHQAHMVISPLHNATNYGEAIDQSIHFMRFAEKLTQGLRALGYFWTTSEILLLPDQFIAATEQALDATKRHEVGEVDAVHDLPIALWVDVRLFSDENKIGFIAGRTQGLSSFMGYEIEIPFIEWSPEQVHSWLVNLVNYVFKNGPILNHGQTIGIDSETQFRLSLEPHPASSAPTMILMLEHASKH